MIWKWKKSKARFMFKNISKWGIQKYFKKWKRSLARGLELNSSWTVELKSSAISWRQLVKHTFIGWTWGNSSVRGWGQHFCFMFKVTSLLLWWKFSLFCCFNQFYEALKPYRSPHLGASSIELYREAYQSLPYPHKEWWVVFCQCPVVHIFNYKHHKNNSVPTSTSSLIT